MDQDLFEWLLLLGRWVHITTAITWIGTSIFFMWLDRSFEENPKATSKGHVGDLWMVHGGGFYHVEKLKMGSTQVPEHLHWFKWESYWTWMSGFYLLSLIFYTSSGTFLLDSSVSSINFVGAVILSLASIFVSWFFYDYLWEHPYAKEKPQHVHIVTALWVVGVSYLLCKTLSGRAAYLHVGAMLGTWMAANVFMRIIPRQVKMVEAAKKGESVNPDWAVNAKNRSTHNTYFTLPVIFIMLSNHFPMTYGHELNWLILILLCAAGALIRKFFILRITTPKNARLCLLFGAALVSGVIVLTRNSENIADAPPEAKLESQDVSSTPMVNTVPEAVIPDQEPAEIPVVTAAAAAAAEASSASAANSESNTKSYTLKGVVAFEGTAPEMQKLMLPQACAKKYKGEVRSNEVMLKNGKLQNVLVRVVSGHEKLPVGPVPAEPVILDQRGCLYEPRVAAARVGQDVTFVNSDEVFHNVKSLSKENKAFNIGMPQLNQRETRRFTKPEMFVEAKCSVHPWMMAHVAVMDHPYFAVTKSDGSFEIPGLPAGTYGVEFWHEVLGTKSETFTIPAQGAQLITETFRK